MQNSANLAVPYEDLYGAIPDAMDAMDAMDPTDGGNNTGSDADTDEYEYEDQDEDEDEFGFGFEDEYEYKYEEGAPAEFFQGRGRVGRGRSSRSFPEVPDSPQVSELGEHLRDATATGAAQVLATTGAPQPAPGMPMSLTLGRVRDTLAAGLQAHAHGPVDGAAFLCPSLCNAKDGPVGGYELAWVPEVGEEAAAGAAGGSSQHVVVHNTNPAFPNSYMVLAPGAADTLAELASARKKVTLAELHRQRHLRAAVAAADAAHATRRRNAAQRRFGKCAKGKGKNTLASSLEPLELPESPVINFTEEDLQELTQVLQSFHEADQHSLRAKQAAAAASGQLAQHMACARRMDKLAAGKLAAGKIGAGKMGAAVLSAWV